MFDKVGSGVVRIGRFWLGKARQGILNRKGRKKMQVKSVKVGIKGISPLIMHKFPEGGQPKAFEKLPVEKELYDACWEIQHDGNYTNWEILQALFGVAVVYARHIGMITS